MFSSIPNVCVRSCAQFAIAYSCLFGSAHAGENTFPTRPIRLIVGYPAGGATDVAARILAQKLTPVVSQNLVVDNRSGASGMIGAAIVAKAEYKGSAPAIADLLGGQVQMAFDTIPVTVPQVRAGKLKALAVAAAKRSALAPEVPTMDESGVPNFVGGTWFGVLAPARTPASVVDRLYKESAAILRSPDVVQTFNERGFESGGNTPAEFRAFIESEVRRWLKVAQDAGIKPE
ncbi:MAG: Bug family tripartite tricarboxylate transporter substrate binding protein [Burkholderiales bacterium]